MANLKWHRYPNYSHSDREAEYRRYVDAGARLRELHLLAAPDIDKYVTTVNVPGSNVVEYRKHEGRRLWINSEQYFDEAAPEVWSAQSRATSLSSNGHGPDRARAVPPRHPAGPANDVCRSEDA